MTRNRFDLIDQEQLAAQVNAVMDAHFERPSIDEKKRILDLARQQLDARQTHHIPRPYVPKVGDRVRVSRYGDDRAGFDVIAVAGDKAWLNLYNRDEIWPISELSLADK